MIRPPHRLLFLTPLVVAALAASARAQQADPPPGAVVVPTEGGNVVVTPGETTSSQIYIPPPGFPQPGTDPNAGLPSSSRPITGDRTDGFDLENQGSSAAVMHGSKGASGVVTLTSRGRAQIVPGIHVVERGDTLWDLCARYFQNPWNWPKLWSYNPQIQNPHWIYPGDQVRMRDPNAPNGDGGGGRVSRLAPGQTTSLAGAGGRGGEGPASNFVDRRSAVPGNTVFLRDQGYIGDPKRDVWGELVGAREDQMLLSEGNHVYMTIRPGVDVREGQELTIFRSARKPQSVKGSRRPPGEIVAIKGTVRVDHWDPKNRIARGRIVESVDVIERGAKIGPVGRRFDVVPPRANQVSIWARVLTGVYPHVFHGQNQIVFLDKGSEDGLRTGNTLIVVRKGDTWRRSLRTTAGAAKDRVVMDSPRSVDVETTPLRGDEDKFPPEAIAELRILRTEKFSSVALVTESSREIIAGDRALARKGY
jgi:hypothetical protein